MSFCYVSSRTYFCCLNNCISDVGLISQEIIDHIRGSSHSAAYASSMAPPVAMQVISSMKMIMGEDGTDEG